MNKNVGLALAGVVVALLFFWPSVWLLYVEFTTGFFRDPAPQIGTLATLKGDNEVLFDYIFWLLSVLVAPATYVYLRGSEKDGQPRAPTAALSVLIAVLSIVLLQGLNFAIVQVRLPVVEQAFATEIAEALSTSTSDDLKASLGLLVILLGIRVQEAIGGTNDGENATG